MSARAGLAPTRRLIRRVPHWWQGVAGLTSGARSARHKISRLIAVALIAVALLVGSSVVSIGVLRHRVGDLALRVEPQSAQNREIRVAMNQSQADLRDYLTNGGARTVARFLSRLPALESQLDSLRQGATGEPALAVLTADQQTLAAAWLSDYAEPFLSARIARSDTTSADRAAMAFESFGRVNDKIGGWLQQRTAQLVRESRQLAVVAILGILLIGLAGFIRVLNRGLRALRFIGPPLESLYRTVLDLRAGDLSVRADPYHGVVEIRAVAAALNAMAETRQDQQTRLTQDLRDSEFVRQIVRAVNHSLDVADVITSSVAPIATYFNTSTTWIRAWEAAAETGPGIRVGYPVDRQLNSPTFLINCAHHIATLGWERQTCYVLGPADERDPDFISAEDHEAMLDHIGTVDESSINLVPLGSGPDALGYLALSRPSGAPRWTESERMTLVQVGRDLGQAIVNARIFRREQQLVTELKALDAKKQNFVSMVSHELRTPLAALVGHLEIVREGEVGEVPATMTSSLEAMGRNSSRLSRLIEDLLVISRVEDSEPTRHARVLDLSPLAAEVVQLHAAGARRGAVEIVLTAPEPVEAFGDPEELERALSNLVGNAIKFSASGSTVRVEVRAVDPGLGGGSVVQVEDRGMGIAAEDQAQLFTRFFRSTNPDALTVPGTGLGLAITKQILTKHRGSITLTSELGVGTCFLVELPPVEDQDRAREQRVRSRG